MRLGNLSLGFQKFMGGGGSTPSLVSLGTSWTAVGDSMTYRDYRLKSYTYWLNLALDGRLFFPTTYNRGNSSHWSNEL